MRLDKNIIRRILLITLSNIGDVVLTLPVLRVLEREFPDANIDILVGPNGAEIFKGEPSVSKIIVYNKHASFSEKLNLSLAMRAEGFDLVVDLKDTIFPLIIGAPFSTSLFKRSDPKIHRKQKHLHKLSTAGVLAENAPFSITYTRDDKLHGNVLLNEIGILPEDKIVAIAAGSKSHTKRWVNSGFMRLSDMLNKELGLKVLLIGDENDKPINKEIADVGLNDIYDLSGRTNIRELAYLLSLCKLLITNDSAPLHIASAVSLPTIAIFGPTDPAKYGPLAPRSVVIRKDLRCSPCQKALCKYNHECMKEIAADDVFKVAKEILGHID